MAGQMNPDRDEPLSMPLDTETALRALLAVEPVAEDDDEALGDVGPAVD